MMSFAHPLHPMLIIWPMAFLSTAYAIDGLQPLITSLPPSLLRYIPHGSELTCLSYYALGAGVITAIPAAVAGVLQANELNKRERTIYESDGKTLKLVMKRLWTHALLNDIIILASAYTWWKRRAAGGAVYPPAQWMFWVSMVLGPVLIFSGNLGGALVFDHGAGVKQTEMKKKAK